MTDFGLSAGDFYSDLTVDKIERYLMDQTTPGVVGLTLEVTRMEKTALAVAPCGEGPAGNNFNVPLRLQFTNNNTDRSLPALRVSAQTLLGLTKEGYDSVDKYATFAIPESEGCDTPLKLTSLAPGETFTAFAVLNNVNPVRLRLPLQVLVNNGGAVFFAN